MPAETETPNLEAAALRLQHAQSPSSPCSPGSSLTPACDYTYPRTWRQVARRITRQAEAAASARVTTSTVLPERTRLVARRASAPASAACVTPPIEAPAGFAASTPPAAPQRPGGPEASATPVTPLTIRRAATEKEEALLRVLQSDSEAEEAIEVA